MNKKTFRRILAVVLALAIGTSTVTVNPASAAKKVKKLTVKKTGATLYEGQKLTKSTLKKVVTVKALYKGQKKAKKVTTYTCTQQGKVVKPSAGKFKLTVKAGGKKKSVKVPVAKVKSLQLSANNFTLVEGEAFKTSAFKAKAKVMAGYAGGIYMNISTYKVEVVSVTAKEVTLRATYGSIKSNKVTVKFVAKATTAPKPSASPSATAEPSTEPSASAAPSASASASAEPTASATPSASASVAPSASASPSASVAPSASASAKPTVAPTVKPTATPTVRPTVAPTTQPSTAPSSSPATKEYTVTVNSSVSNIKINGRNMTFSNGTASEKFTSGTSVTLTATDSNANQFVRWASNGAELSTNKSYTFTVNSNISINAVFEGVYTLTVKRVGGKGRVTVAGESLDFYSNVATVNLVPGSYQLVAIPTDDYKFISIADEKGKILSTSTSYEVNIGTSAKTVIVNFAEEKTVSVTYVNHLGETLKSEAVAFGESSAPSNNVNRSGFVFKGWQIGNTVYYGNAGASEFYATNGTSLSDAIKSLTAAKTPVTVQAYYEAEPTVYYQLTLTNGQVTDSTLVTANGVEAGTHVTVSANAPASGKKFSCWINGNGTAVSYETEYTFVMSGNIALTATYVADSVPVQAEPLVYFTGNGYSIDYDKTMLTFTLGCEIPEGYTISEWGLLMSTSLDISDIKLGANVTKAVCPTQSTDLKVNWTYDLTKPALFNKTRTVRAVAYAVVTSVNGTKTIYSSDKGNYCEFTVSPQ